MHRKKEGQMKIAVIPARGGSKRIPLKNIRPFLGKPLIAYSLSAARKSGLFDRIIVSTDSEEVAAIAREWGAETPFMRPAELSDDFTPNQKVLSHAFAFFEEQESKSVSYMCCIYPTAPFVSARRLKEAYSEIEKDDADAVVSVTSFPYPIFRGLRRDENGFVNWFWPENELTRSNDLPEAWHDAGQFYWFNGPRFRELGRLMPPLTKGYILPRVLVQDIDTEEDWHTAEILYECCLSKGLLD